MSLLDTLADLGEDKGPGAIEKLASRARDLADENLDGPERDLAKAALDSLETHSEDLAHLGTAGLVSLVATFGFHGADEAKLLYLEERATFAERIAASEASTDETVRAKINRELAWEGVRETLETVGKIALKLLPLLLAAA